MELKQHSHYTRYKIKEEIKANVKTAHSIKAKQF